MKIEELERKTEEIIKPLDQAIAETQRITRVLNEWVCRLDFVEGLRSVKKEEGRYDS
jgi:hypothetical protein